MKLHRIGVTNLNSLYGTHTVDLDGDLHGATLFLIQGPTGSGKSTLMDAVSLALFGTTPRMEGHRAEKSVAEQVMSRDTGECQAELVFSKWSHEAGERIRYRARWLARRAREKPDGQVQNTERSLERRDREGNWEILVSDHRQKFYQPHFDEVLEGFSQEDFRRSMLLAQGQFDAMLHAKPEERARILERLTDTSEYKRIGERAARIHRAWAERLRDLDRDLASRDPVEPEKIEEAEKERAGAEAALATVDQRSEAIRVRRDWLAAESDWRRKVTEAEGGLLKAQEALEARKDLLVRIEEHDRCAPGFEALDATAKQRGRVEKSAEKIQKLEADLPDLRKATAKAETDARAVAERHAAADSACQRLEPVVDRAEAARIRLTELERAETTAAQGAEQAKAELEARHTRLSAAESEVSQALARLREGLAQAAVPEGGPKWRADVEAVLRDHQVPTSGSLPGVDPEGDESRDEGARRPDFEGAGTAIRGLRDEVDGRRDPLRRAVEARGALASARVDHAAREKARTIAAEMVEAAVASMEKASRDREEAAQRRDQARQVMAPLDRIRIHQEERESLEEGKACPLCGSKHHPMVGEEADSDLRREIAAAQAAVEAADNAFTAAEASFHGAEGHLTAARGQLDQRETERATAEGTVARASEAWTAAAAELGVDLETPQAELRRLEEALGRGWGWLQEVLDRITATGTGYAAWSNARGEVRDAEGRGRKAEEARAGAAASARKAREAFAGEMEKVRGAWSAAVALDGPDTPPRPHSTDDLMALKKSQQSVVRSLAGALHGAKEAQAAAATKLSGAERELSTVRDRLETDTAELTTLEQGLQRRLEGLGLASVGDLAERRLADHVLRDGRGEVERLRKSVAETQTRLETLRGEQTAHVAVKPNPLELEWIEGEPTPDACAAALDDLSRRRTELNERITQARSLLLEAQRVAADIEEIRAKREDAGAKAEVWHQLHDLIGVRDGDRFREFAQALNLDRLLDRANQHLTTLKDRYRLVTVRDPDTGVPTLEFEVEDRWRPGTTRSLKTLSGGEGFLVSLALALGLSDLRTSSMPVETLLLDEGFGTLDPETLEVALAALQQLQASGRQIGIISHVAGLQERIDARIQVEPLGNGRSRVRAVIAGV